MGSLLWNANLAIAEIRKIWFGLFGFSLSQSFDNFWLIICPLSMLAMFIFASIPMMDNRSLERRPDYEEYMKKTPALIPSLFK